MTATTTTRRAVTGAVIVTGTALTLTGCQQGTPPSWAANLPDIPLPLVVGGALIAMSLFAMAGGIDADGRPDGLSAHRDIAGPAAGALRAESAAGNAITGLFIALGVALIGWGIGGGAVLLGLAVAGLIGWASIARFGWLHTVQAGFQLADQRWIEAAETAERNGEQAPAEPHMTRAAAHALGLTKGFVTPDGSAAAAMLGIDGGDRPVRAAWGRVAEALSMGSTDEAGKFTPWATVANVTAHPDGDVTVAWELSEIRYTAKSFKSAALPLLRELKVRSMGDGFLTNHTDGTVYARFSNSPDAAQPAEAPKADRGDDDDWDF